MRPFGCHVTILNTLDPLGKFDGMADEGFFVGYSVNSKAFRVFNSRTRIVQETLHINFLENKPNVAGIGPKWLFDIDTLTQSMNYQLVVAGNQPNDNANPQNSDADVANAAFDVKENENEVYVSLSGSDKTKKHDDKAKRVDKGKNPSKYHYDPNMPELEDIVYSDDKEDDGIEADLSNVETNISVSPIPTTRVHKDHHVNQIIGDLNSAPQTRSMAWVVKEQGGLHQINDEDFHTSYASFMGFMLYQMDVKSDFLYRTIEEEVYVCQPLGYEDPDYPDKVYKLVKVLYGLHQALRACQDKYVAEILRKFGFTDVKSASTPIETEKPLLKDPDGENVDVHIYRSMIGSLMYITSFKPDIMFTVCACARFQVTPKVSHLHAVKRICRYLKGKPHLVLWYAKDSPFNLVTYSDSHYVRASLDRKSITGGCQFLGCRLISWQCKKQTVVSTSLTEAEYVVAASCCAHVLWIQNQLLDYSLELASPKQTALGKDNSNPFMAGVNTPRCDEDSLELMELMVFMYALVVNPTIYVSCIKQFWASATIKKEIFVELARMGYEKPLPKLKFYKAFFSAQWKFLIDTLVQYVSANRTTWNDFSYSMESAVICLATETCATLSQKVVELEQDKHTQALKIIKLKNRVKKLEKKKNSKSSGLNRLRKIEAIDADEDVTLVDVETQVDMDAELQGRIDQDVNAATKEVNTVEPTVFNDEEVTMTMAQTLINMKAKKANLLDEQIAQRLHDEEIEKAAAREKKEKDDFERAQVLQKKYQSLKRKPVSIAQARKNMIIYLKNMAGYKMEHFRGMTYDKIKYPIIDWEIHFEGSRTYWKIIRADGITEAYQSFEDMLKGFDIEDLVTLWSLVKAKFSSAVPNVDKEKALWVDLKRLFEPDADDVLHDMFMLTEKDYPLSNGVMTLMMSAKLQVEEDSKMARDLVMKIFMEANKPKSRNKIGLRYRDQLSESDSEVLPSIFDSRSSDGDDNPTNDRFKKDDGYHVVPPPLTRNYMPPLADLSFAGLDDYVYRPTANKASASISKSEPNVIKTSNISVEMLKVDSVRISGVIIEDWVSDDEDTLVDTQGNPQQALKYKGMFDSGCSRHMTWNKALLTDYQDIDGGFVAFGGSTKGGKITEFKNREMDEFCGQKGIKKEYSVARTPQQNGVAERKNRTLIEAARTMLAESLLPTIFWAEAVNIACYVLNRVLVTKPHNKTPYKLIIGRPPSISFMRPFGCPVTILNTLDPLGKFYGKTEEGFLVGYSVNSNALRVFNTQTRKVEENLHVNFLENKPNVAGQGHKEVNGDTGLKKNVDVGRTEQEKVSTQQYIMFPVWSFISSSYKSSDDKAEDNTADVAASKENVQELVKQSDDVRKEFQAQCNSQLLQEKVTKSSSTNSITTVSTPVNTVSASRPFIPPHDPLMPELEDTTKIQTIDIFGNAYDEDDLDTNNHSYADESVGAEADFNNMKPFTVVEVMQEELFQFKIQKVWTLVDLPNGKKAIGTKWVYRNKKDERGIIVIIKARLVAQRHTQEEGIDYDEIDVKSVFLYGTIEEEVYVSQPLGFVDPEFLDQVYKINDWVIDVSYILKTRYYVLSLCVLKISSSAKVSHLHAVKIIFRYLKGQPKLGLWYLKDSPLTLEAFSDSNYAGASLDKKSTTGGCQFLGSRLISWQCKKQTVVANSTTEVEYIAASQCCRQVL
nr:putative ribonuclease H-like domain-containing protein [Tanacetum cinerariifolium]